MILKAKNIHKTFGREHVLRGINLELHPRETVAIMGKSGAGKSTLLHILGTLDKPTEGELTLLQNHSKAANLRNQTIGFIFQAYHLLEDFSVLENVLMPQKIARSAKDPSHGKNLLTAVGLHGKEHLLAKYLSGGEKQRACIARALCNHPTLLLADEPTGNLDEEHSKEIQELLIHKAKEFNAGLIVVTHDEQFANKCDRILLLKEGQLYNKAS